MASLVRAVRALGLSEQLQALFVLKLQSIAQMEQAQLRQPSAGTAHRARPWTSRLMNGEWGMGNGEWGAATWRSRGQKLKNLTLLPE